MGDTNKYDVFISYSRRDLCDEQGKEIQGSPVGHILRSLTKNGVTFWMDKKRIKGGSSFGTEIAKAIFDSDIFIYISSVNSNSSKWAIKEVAHADALGKHIIPIRIDASAYGNGVNYYLADLDYIDYANDSREGIKRLLKAIANSETASVIPNRIAFKKRGVDIKLDNVLLSKHLTSMFMAKNVSEAITLYDKIVSAINANIDNLNSCVIDSQKRLNILKDYKNVDLQREEMARYVTSIRDKVEECTDLDKLLLQLSLLLCYFYLNEPILLNKVHKTIKDIEISQSFWDEYGGVVKGVGTAIAGFAAALMGATPAAAGYGIKAGSEVNESHKNRVKKYQKYYTALRDMISSIEFL